MVRLLLALLLSAPASALDADAPGAAALKARGAVEALPVEARVELRKMFLRYQEEVARRLDDGWQYGLLNDAVIEDVDEPFQPGRLLEDAVKKREADVAAARAEFKLAGLETPERDRAEKKLLARKAELKSLRSKLAREKGICRDWSDDVWFLLTSMNLEHWSVDDRRRTAPPFHTAAVACAPQEDPTICLAFDPWTDGKGQVYSFNTWDAKDPGGRLPANYFLHGLPEKAP